MSQQTTPDRIAGRALDAEVDESCQGGSGGSTTGNQRACAHRRVEVVAGGYVSDTSAAGSVLLPASSRCLGCGAINPTSII